MKSKRSKAKKKDCYDSVLIVIGNNLKKDGRPSPFLLSRIERALDLYHEKRFDKVVLTGGPAAYPVPEAEVMAPFFYKAVPKSDIILETRSLETLQNALFTWELLKDLPIKRIAVVTSDFHIPKVRYVFKHIFAHKKVKFLFVPARSDVSFFSRLKHRLIAYYGICHDFFVFRKNKKEIE